MSHWWFSRTMLSCSKMSPAYTVHPLWNAMMWFWGRMDHLCARPLNDICWDEKRFCWWAALSTSYISLRTVTVKLGHNFQTIHWLGDRHFGGGYPMSRVEPTCTNWGVAPTCRECHGHPSHCSGDQCSFGPHIAIEDDGRADVIIKPATIQQFSNSSYLESCLACQTVNLVRNLHMMDNALESLEITMNKFQLAAGTFPYQTMLLLTTRRDKMHHHVKKHFDIWNIWWYQYHHMLLYDIIIYYNIL